MNFGLTDNVGSLIMLLTVTKPCYQKEKWH